MPYTMCMVQPTTPAFDWHNDSRTFDFSSGTELHSYRVHLKDDHWRVDVTTGFAVADRNYVVLHVETVITRVDEDDNHVASVSVIEGFSVLHLESDAERCSTVTAEGLEVAL